MPEWDPKQNPEVAHMNDADLLRHIKDIQVWKTKTVWRNASSHLGEGRDDHKLRKNRSCDCLHIIFENIYVVSATPIVCSRSDGFTLD